MLSPAAAMRLLRAHARKLRPAAKLITDTLAKGGRRLAPHKPKARPKPKPAEFVMYDSINLDAIPAKAAAVAGYVNGRWPTFTDIRHEFPRAKHLSIAVTAAADADCLDVEKGDATIAQAPAWAKRQHARGLDRPVVYCSVSVAGSLLAALAKAGIPRARVRLWTAHYTGKPHRCTKACGNGFAGEADATQYTDRALGRSLDASVCHPDFL